MLAPGCPACVSTRCTCCVSPSNRSCFQPSPATKGNEVIDVVLERNGNGAEAPEMHGE